jgi:thiosulfate/3-mercaptopyruvate sulfurtransferase
MPYSFGHIKNARPLSIEKMVIMLADNGANLVIESAAPEKVFGSLLGIGDSKKVIVYGEQDDPSSARIACSVIIYHGHTDVKMLDIGFQAWRHVGLRVTRGICRK